MRPSPLLPDEGLPVGIPRVMRHPGVLLMAYGGPSRMDQVEAYYTDIRHGRPPSPRLLEELLGRYRAIGGGSPLSGIVERQRAALEHELGRRGVDPPVYAGMRHIEPRIGPTLERMVAQGVDSVVALALAPQRSPSIVGYRDAVEAALPGLGTSAPVVELVESWHDEPGFIYALSHATAEALAAAETLAGLPRPMRAAVVFTAHSLPARLGLEAEAYRSEVEETAALVAGALGLSEHAVALQSAGRTDEPWLGPDLRDEIRRLARKGTDAVVVCPVGFVSDHLEVLYDIDIEARAVADDAGVQLVRARSLNDDATFIGALADVVVRVLNTSLPPRSITIGVAR